MVFSSHQLDLVQDLCEDITMIDQGRTVLQGEVAALRASSGRRQLRLHVQTASRDWLLRFPDLTVVSDEADDLRLAIRPEPIPSMCSTQPGRRVESWTSALTCPLCRSCSLQRWAGPTTDGGAVMGTWLKGTRLVFERGLVENLRSKSFKVVTGLLLLLSIAAVTLPQLFGDDTTTYTLATVGEAPADLVATLDAAGDAGGFDVEYVTRDDRQQLRQAVRDGDATVGFSGDTLYAAAIDAGTFPVVVAQAAVTLETTRTLAEAGLSPQQVAQVQSIRPPEQVTVAAVEDEDVRLSASPSGSSSCWRCSSQEPRSRPQSRWRECTRISEVLLAVLRPSQILVGTVLAVGTVTFSQLLVLVGPLAVAVQVTDNIGLPSVAAGDMALAIAWFLLGFALYAFLYAASGPGRQGHRGGRCRAANRAGDLRWLLRGDLHRHGRSTGVWASWPRSFRSPPRLPCRSGGPPVRSRRISAARNGTDRGHRGCIRRLTHRLPARTAHHRPAPSVPGRDRQTCRDLTRSCRRGGAASCDWNRRCSELDKGVHRPGTSGRTSLACRPDGTDAGRERVAIRVPLAQRPVVFPTRSPTAEGGAIVTKIYIPYGTTEGQTAKIAEYIADVIRGHGHEADTADIKRSGLRRPGWLRCGHRRGVHPYGQAQR